MKIENITVGEFAVNCFVIRGDDNRVLVIDPGADADAISAFLDKNGLSVAAYLLTHGHMDHISALADLHKRFPAPVGLHAADQSWAFTEVNQMPPFYGIPSAPESIERDFTTGLDWNDAGLKYKVIATPGHTPGGVCFYFPEERVVFSGDTLFAGSVGRTDLPGGSSRILKESLDRLALLDDDVRVYPGHGPATRIGHEKRTNFFMQG